MLPVGLASHVHPTGACSRTIVCTELSRKHRRILPCITSALHRTRQQPFLRPAWDVTIPGHRGCRLLGIWFTTVW